MSEVAQNIDEKIVETHKHRLIQKEEGLLTPRCNSVYMKRKSNPSCGYPVGVTLGATNLSRQKQYFQQSNTWGIFAAPLPAPIFFP